METSDRGAAVADVIAWLNAVEADQEARRDLVELAEGLLRHTVGLQALHRGALTRRQNEIADMDQAAVRVRQFQPLMIPGLFHSEAYARACIEAANFVGESDVERAVAARLERGRRLTEPGAPDFHVVLFEEALRWRPLDCLDDNVVLAQRNIVRAARRKNVVVQVVLSGTPTAALPQCGFTIWEWRDAQEPSLVLLETPSAEVTFVGDPDLVIFDEVWNRMVDAALSPRETDAWLAAQVC